MSSDDEPVSTPETSKGSKRVKEEIAAASTSKKRREEDDGDRRWVSDDDGQESGDDEEYEDVEDSDNEESPLLSLDQWKVQELKILDDEMMKAKWPMVKSNADKWHILVSFFSWMFQKKVNEANPIFLKNPVVLFYVEKQNLQCYRNFIGY